MPIKTLCLGVLPHTSFCLLHDCRDQDIPCLVQEGEYQASESAYLTSPGVEYSDASRSKVGHSMMSSLQEKPFALVPAVK